MRNGLEFLTGLIAPHISFMMDVAAGEITSGRARALGGAAVGLISVIVGGIALLRSAGPLGKVGSIAALLIGLIGIVLSAIHLSGATGGFGTGGGRLGSIVGLILGLIGMSLGGLALTRARRADTRSAS